MIKAKPHYKGTRGYPKEPRMISSETLKQRIDKMEKDLIALKKEAANAKLDVKIQWCYTESERGSESYHPVPPSVARTKRFGYKTYAVPLDRTALMERIENVIEDEEEGE